MASTGPSYQGGSTRRDLRRSLRPETHNEAFSVDESRAHHGRYAIDRSDELHAAIYASFRQLDCHRRCPDEKDFVARTAVPK